MDTSILADAIVKLADVHDKRLGEIAVALNRLADQLSHSDDPNAKLSGIEHHASMVADALNNISTSIDDAAGAAQTPKV